MKANLFALALAASLLTGCAGQPKRQLSRDEWLTTTSRVYSDVSKDQVITAADKVLRLADGDDFSIQHTEDGFNASRNWMAYIVIAAAMGTDYWRFTVAPVPEGIKANIQASTQAGSVMPMMTAGPGPGTGWTATTGPMTGSMVDGNFLYEIFWARMDYLLGKSDKWISCSDIDAFRKTKALWGNEEALCNGFNITDSRPDL